MIKLKNISKKYISNDIETTVLKNINLEINKGDLLAIVGPSGSGKSTLLNILGLMDNYTTGEYLYKNQKLDINSISAKELAKKRNSLFGFIFQHFALIDNLTVKENLELPIKYKCKYTKTKFDKKVTQEKILKELTKFNLQDKLNSYPYELSGGEQQRISIIRSIINDAEIILADEPTGALDKNMSSIVFQELLKLNQNGKTIIIVTHDLTIADKCTKVFSL